MDGGGGHGGGGDRSRRASRDTGRHDGVPGISTTGVDDGRGGAGLAAPAVTAGMASKSQSLRTPPGSTRTSMQFLSPTGQQGERDGDLRLSITIPLPPSPSIAV
jgi:hypothetical protein